MRILGVVAAAWILPAVTLAGAQRSTQPAAQQSSPATVSPPTDAQELRAQIRAVESVLPKLPDRGAALFLLARRYARLGDLAKALSLLKECMALDAGFTLDPNMVRSLKPLEGNAEFRAMAAQARLRYPPVHRAKIAFTVPAIDLFPEGLTVDTSTGQFYMGSMYRKKIVNFTLGGAVSDFVKQDVYDLSPIGGVHVDPADHTVWAATDAGERQRPELLHFDVQGKLLERYASPGKMPHDLNDLVLHGSREIFATDTEGNHVYRFDRSSRSFTSMKLWRPVFEPNGITLSGDGNLLFVADDLGVIRVDLATGMSEDVDPGPHNTLCGIDGLYWQAGEFLAVEYGTGMYRVMRWQLSPDGRKVTASNMLEYRSELLSDPTTGVVYGDSFYFIANTGISNLDGDKIVDPAKLEPVNIAVVPLH